MSHFYVTLPSNSSMDHHPNNTVARFITALSQNIELDGDWEVGLAEICIPAIWYNITSSMTSFTFNDQSFAIPVGYYPSVKEVLENMVHVINGNHVHEKAKFEVVRQITRNVSAYNLNEDQIGFLFNPIRDEIGIALPRRSHLYINDDLATVFGMTSYVLQNNNSLVSHIVAKGRRGTTLQKSLPLAYVYCDIIEPAFVGDSKVQLLRTVNVDSSNQSNITHIFTNPIYIPLQKKHFNSIEINIMTSTGQLVPFAPGHSVVTLHFRRTTNPYFLSR